VRYLESALDPLKAEKSWKKELISGNSEKFEFLKLNIASEDAVDMSEKTREWMAKSKLPAKAVKFQVIVREKGSGRLLPFDEESIFLLDVPSRTQKPSKNALKASSSSSVVDSQQLQWQYSIGTVTPIKEEVLEELMKDVTKYQTIATIRDKW